jgi:hypothetical protein
MSHYKIQFELMEAVARSREARREARKRVDALLNGPKVCPSPSSPFSIKDAFREHALATAAHNAAVKELREYHLNGRIPHRLESASLAFAAQVFGTRVATDIPVAL